MEEMIFVFLERNSVSATACCHLRVTHYQTIRALLGSAADEPPFKLAGSLAMAGEVESAVAELRERERQASNARLADL